MSSTRTAGEVRLDHLDRLTDHHGVFEHADGVVPRDEHGYCVDDNARLLIVACRESGRLADRLGRVALSFLLGALDADGRSRNRMDHAGRWTDAPGTDDCWGRSLWGLGSAAAHHEDPLTRQLALGGFERAIRQRSRWPRAMAFAALGAAAVTAVDPEHTGARDLLVDAVSTIGPILPGEWVWTEPRLRYANATLAEAMIAAGHALDDGGALDQGLAMLGWLLALETRDGHLSVTGVAGRDPSDPGVQFDQQPIEVAAMADACWRAWSVTGGERWADGIDLAAAWFDGHNDTGAVMHDERSGGGFDGLQPVGVNRNQGAESTLAFVSTMQRARRTEPLG